jgi:hypothetical protein
MTDILSSLTLAILNEPKDISSDIHQQIINLLVSSFPHENKFKKQRFNNGNYKMN